MQFAETTNSDSGTTNVNHRERWFSVVTGAALAAYGLTRRSVAGVLAAAAGGVMLWRGATGHCPLYDALGVSTAEPSGDSHISVRYGKGFRVEKSVTVNASPDELYRFWRKLDNLPRFMSYLQAVDVIDDKHSHWRTKGPAGSRAEWDAEIINEIPNELIGWRSVDGSTVNNAGSVHFQATAHGTEVKVVLRYDPPAGAVGAAVAKMFGDDPAHQVQEDLRQFKEIVETGEVARAK